MYKNIKDMSLADIEAELSKARAMNDRVSQIQSMVLDIKGAINDLIKKTDSIVDAIDHVSLTTVGEQLALPGIITAPQATHVKRILHKKKRSKSKIFVSAIKEILLTEALNSNQIHKKLAERGLVKPIDSEGGRFDYNFTRSIISAMKKRQELYRENEDRGTPWKLN